MALLVVILGIAISEFMLGTVTILNQYILANIDSEITGKIIRSEERVLGLGTKAPQREYLIRYEYLVDDRKYVGELINYKTAIEDTAEILARYPINKEVTVYFDSAKPEYSILERGYVGFEVWFQVFVIFVGLPIMTFIVLKALY